MPAPVYRDPLLDDALQIVTRFGPERLRPREERLLELHPGVPAERLRTLFEVGTRIEDWAYELAGQVDAGLVSSEQALQQVLTAYPDLTVDTAKLTLGHGAYYWWRDHG